MMPIDTPALPAGAADPNGGALFEILDETPDWLAVNKPGNLVCHPTKGGPDSSLIGRLRLYFAGQPEVRPSFVNRLDRETSGVVLIAKNPQTHALMQRAFQQGRVEKIYRAVVQGVPAQPEGEINLPLAREPDAEIVIRQAVQSTGAPSLTRWKLLHPVAGTDTVEPSVARTGSFSILEVRPQTGRLHQIRVHLASLGHPIVGDKLYGPDPRLYLEFIRTGWTPTLEKQLLVPRQLLHAAELRIGRSDGGELGCWKAAVPADMTSFLQRHGLDGCNALRN